MATFHIPVEVSSNTRLGPAKCRFLFALRPAPHSAYEDLRAAAVALIGDSCGEYFVALDGSTSSASATGRNIAGDLDLAVLLSRLPTELFLNAKNRQPGFTQGPLVNAIATQAEVAATMGMLLPHAAVAAVLKTRPAPNSWIVAYPPPLPAPPPPVQAILPPAQISSSFKPIEFKPIEFVPFVPLQSKVTRTTTAATTTSSNTASAATQATINVPSESKATATPSASSVATQVTVVVPSVSKATCTTDRSATVATQVTIVGPSVAVKGTSPASSTTATTSVGTQVTILVPGNFDVWRPRSTGNGVADILSDVPSVPSSPGNVAGSGSEDDEFLVLQS
ncbi:hypothetical protein HK405_013183 [Cladochytrium tenue]|nr:hypothetical protein HK405_013183 [Cladochytrium tenue]